MLQALTQPGSQPPACPVSTRLGFRLPHINPASRPHAEGLRRKTVGKAGCLFSFPRAEAQPCTPPPSHGCPHVGSAASLRSLCPPLPVMPWVCVRVHRWREGDIEMEALS